MIHYRYNYWFNAWFFVRGTGGELDRLTVVGNNWPLVVYV